MINGSVIAPFRHDSTWPDGVQTGFRAAVYYRHARVPGRDAVSYLRELTSLVLREKKPRDTSTQWEYLRDACDKVVHLAIKGTDDEEMPKFVTNLLVFANLLLIRDYGLEASSSMQFEADEPARKEEHELKSKAARKRFLESIHDAYESLEASIKKLKQRGGSLRGPLELEKGAAVLAPIPSSLHVIDARDVSRGKLVCVINDTDNCEYVFHPHDPIGWMRISGSRAKDRFADDAMSSENAFGT